MGAYVMNSNTTGASNTAIGFTALGANTTGLNNVAVGYQALNSNTTAGYQTAIGYQALYSANKTSNTLAYSTAVGYFAGKANTTGDITAIGTNVLLNNTTGTQNVGVGGESDAANCCLKSNTTGSYNTAVGVYALQANTTANGNSAFGWAALGANVTGVSNAAFGKSALQNNTASYNSALGYEAGFSNTTGERNTAVGYQALYTSTTASNNTAVGHWAAKGATTGGLNTCVGDYAGVFLTTGSSNICIGALAGYNQNIGPVTTGGANILIGNDTGLAASSNNHCININTVGSVGKGTSTAFINANGGGVYNGSNVTTWAQTSDQRLKKNIVDNNDGLDAINSIRVRNFEYRLPEEITELDASNAIQKSGIQLGVIAQELQAVLPECVKTESTGVLSVQTDNLTWYMVNAIKELKAENDSLKARLDAANL
jgi:hypothetical protein